MRCLPFLTHHCSLPAEPRCVAAELSLLLFICITLSNSEWSRAQSGARYLQNNPQQHPPLGTFLLMFCCNAGGNKIWVMQLTACTRSRPSGHAGTCLAVWDECSRLGNSRWMNHCLFSVVLGWVWHSQAGNVLEDFTSWKLLAELQFRIRPRCSEPPQCC